MRKIAAVAMSGGIDSAVTAHLLMEQGYKVFGVTMIHHPYNNEIQDAQKVCRTLGIDHHVIDLIEDFESQVAVPFIDNYFCGITPNPCIVCNKEIKFGLLMDAALALGADFFASGHYVRIHRIDGGYVLKRGLDSRKDQSYLFHFMDQNRLSRLLTPLGEFASKDQVRTLAKRLNLPVSGKKDSDGLCFTNGQNYGEYLKSRAPHRFHPGTYIDKSGAAIGTFPSIIYHTVGQKRGLWLHSPHNLRVVSIDPESNQILLGTEEDLYRSELLLKEVTFVLGVPQKENQPLQIQMFQWGLLLPGVLLNTDAGFVIRFDTPVRAIAQGQYAVFYDGDVVIGGGRIFSVL